MPKCGSQCWLCDLPIRFDTYKGCEHGCRYCFAQRKRPNEIIETDESAKTLLKFIQGERTRSTEWCDWNIPIHWGGMADPFTPSEKKYRRSLECLKVFAETQYPFVVSTKGKLIAEEEYRELFSKCNCVLQISAVGSSFNKMEPGAPKFEERLEVMKTMSPVVKRLIVRIQPFLHEMVDEVEGNLEKFKEAGAYGVIIEGMKFLKNKPGLIKVGGDYTYPYNVILSDFLRLKKRAHDLGLKIFAGENRIRAYGDSLSCCGFEGLEGFRGNNYNLNHIVNGDRQEPTPAMKKKGSATCFAAHDQNTVFVKFLQQRSFEDVMEWFLKDETKKELVKSTLTNGKKEI